MSKTTQNYRQPIRGLCGCGYLGDMVFVKMDDIWEQPIYACVKCGSTCWHGNRTVTYTGEKKKEIEERVKTLQKKILLMEELDVRYKQRCIKQHVVAILVKGDEYWVGSNWCNSPQNDCPREEKNMKTGEGYDLCRTVCKQHEHAESDVVLKAGANAVGAVLYLLGHSYICSDCDATLRSCGITEKHIGEIPDLSGKTQREK